MSHRVPWGMASSRGSLQRNPALLCAFHALEMSLFPVAVITLFWKVQLGLTFTEIMALQAWFGIVVAVGELPAGMLADRIGYRRSLLLASAGAGLGFGAYAFVDGAVGAVVAETLLGASMSLVSGTDVALLYESLRASDRESEFRIWFGRVRFFGQIGEGSAALVAGLLYAVSPRLPFVLQACVWCVNFALVLFLVEPARPQRPTASLRVTATHILRTALVDSATLRAIIVLGTALGLASFVPVWVVPLYANEAGVPTAWLGPVWAAANYAVALGALASDRLGRAVGVVPALGGCIVLVVAGYLGLGLSHALLGFSFYFLLTFMRGLNGPLLAHEEQRVVPSADRAAFTSLRSFVFRLAFAVLGPLVGLAMDQAGQRTVLLVLGPSLAALACLGLLLLQRALGRQDLRAGA